MNIEQRLAEIRSRAAEIRQTLETDTTADIAALDAELRTLDTEKQQLEERQKILVGLNNGSIVATPSPIVNPIVAQRSSQQGGSDDIYYRAFFKTLKGEALDEPEQRAYTSAANSAGAAMPTQTLNQVISTANKICPLLTEITLLRVPGNVTIVVEGTNTDAAKHAELSAITPGTDNLVKVTLMGFELVKAIRISKTIKKMSIPAFEDWLISTLARDIAKKIESLIATGAGTDEASGLFTGITFTVGTNAVEATGTTPIGYDHVVDTIALLPAIYDGNAKWLMNKKTLFNQFAKIKDDQKQPILVKDMANGIPYIIMGYPVLVSDYAPNSKAILGDFSYYYGNLAEDINVSMSEHSAFLNNGIDYLATAIFDGKPAVTQAFVQLEKKGT